MILTIAAIAFFILAKIASHYTEKYSGCDDCSWLAWFIGEYWRTSRAIPTTLLYAGLMCVWFETRHLEIVQGLAVLLLFFSAFALMLGLALLIGKTVEAIFGHWDLSEIGYNLAKFVRTGPLG
jgi:hypothetical protein